MCRLMGYVTPASTSFPANAGPKFHEFVDLSLVHKDGWGLAFVDNAGTRIFKEIDAAAENGEFLKLLEQEQSSGGLLHLRWATPGIAISQANSHPFNFNEVSFIHNGAIQDFKSLAKKIPDEIIRNRVGDGDSEIFFLFAISKIQSLGLIPGIFSAVTEITAQHSYSSINSFFLTKDFFIAICENNPKNRPDWASEEYYELRYRLDSNGFLISSSGWDQSGWTELPNHSMLILDRNSLELEIRPLQ
jgi:predicted glutamine amidotransferase